MDPLYTIKAAGDWELDVLGVPFGGPNNGRDAQGEYFDEQTALHPDKWALPPVVYYHGYTPEGKPAGKPEYIGKAVSRWVDQAGVWYRVVLDQANALSKRVMDAARQLAARASSGSISHLVRVGADGHIDEWPVAELSIFDASGKRQPANQYAMALPVAKALYDQAGLQWPDGIASLETTAKGAEMRGAVGGHDNQSEHPDQGETEMDEKDIQAIVAQALAESDAKRKAEDEAKAAQKAAIDAAVEAATATLKADMAAMRRLPGGDGAPVLLRQPGRIYDNLDPATHALALAVMKAKGVPISDGAYEGLYAKAVSEEAKDSAAHEGLKALYQGNPSIQGMKANELNVTTLSSYGLQWVEYMYSQNLWEAIRQEAWVLGQVPQMEIPNGYMGLNIKLESTDPTWYKVAENTTYDSTMLTPVATITASKLGTAEKAMTVSKLGCRALYSGEMAEDSIIRFAPQLLMQMRKSGAETLESAIIDGDSDGTITTNVNDIGGTPTSTDSFLLLDGFRKLALVTNTANSRDGGALAEGDFLATAKMLGTAGMNADITKCAFISDMNTYWKALELSVVKTKDVFSQATLESGRLTGMWGFPYRPSARMHSESTARLANSAGKVDQSTTTNNLYGALLCVRWDQWLFGWHRRMTIESTRFANSDSNEIVAMTRVGLAYRDTEASAISYNLAV